MTVTDVDTRRPGTGRRVGYVVAVLLNAAMLYGANRWPGWDALPFLTDDTARVIGAVNASILVSLAANLVYLWHDPRWLKALGDMVTTAVGLVALVRVWDVFPFDLGGGWERVVQVLLVVGVAGSAIAIVVALVGFVRALGRPG